MKMFRLRFILLGLLLCICHVWCLTCGTEFGDVASSAHFAQIVTLGTVTQNLPPDESYLYNAVVKIKSKRDIFKGSKILKKRLNFRHDVSVTMGKFGEEDLANCVTPIKRDIQYMFFINVTDSTKYYTQSALPVPMESKGALKKAKKEIGLILCGNSDCVKAPTWDHKRKMKNSTVEIGKALELNCKLKKRTVPRTQYTWYKDDADVLTLNITGLSIRNNKKGSRLKIKRSDVTDAGTYKCVAANVGGTIQQRAVIKISGVAEPQNPSRVMKDRRQKFDSTLKLTCRTKSGVKPRPTFFWYKDGKEIKTGSRAGLTIKSRGSQSRLRKKKVVQSDQGLYKCVAKNAGGQAEQSSFVEVIGAPPKLSGPPKKIPCTEEDRGWCLNNGTCEIMVEIKKKYCTCAKGYTGTRCSELIFNIDKAKEKLAQDRNLIIVGIISGILLFIGICVVSYFLAKRRREEFYRRRRQNQNGNIEDNIPQVYRPLIACDEIDGLKKHMNGVVIHKEIQTIETCFLGNDKGNLYINPLEGYIRNDDKNSRSRKPAISIEEDPSPEPATPEDSPEFPTEKNSDIPKNKHSSSNSASDGAPNERLNDLSPRRQGQGRENSKSTGAMNSVPNIQGNDPTKPPAFNLDTDSEDDILSDGTPLTPLHISEEEDNNERNRTNNKQSSASMDKLDEKNRKNISAKEINEPKPLDPSELFPVINRKTDKNPPVNEKKYASSSSSDGSESDSSTTTEGCDSPNTLETLKAELGSDPALHTVIKNNWNERGSPEPRSQQHQQPPPYSATKQDKPQNTAPEARQQRPQGPRGPPPRGQGPRGHGPREHGQRGPPQHREPGSRGYPPREYREHGPRGPGQRDPRDHRDLRDPRDPRDQRDPRDPRDPGSRPPPQRDPRDHRESGPREPGLRGPGPREPGPRPGPPREPGSKGPAPRDPGSRMPPQREPVHRDPNNRVPAPRPQENRGPETQQNIPPFPVFSNFYDQTPMDKDMGQRLKSVGRNQGPIAS